MEYCDWGRMYRENADEIREEETPYISRVFAGDVAPRRLH